MSRDLLPTSEKLRIACTNEFEKPGAGVTLTPGVGVVIVLPSPEIWKVGWSLGEMAAAPQPQTRGLSVTRCDGRGPESSFNELYSPRLARADTT